ncbi:MAG: hypothetical protein J6Z34_03910, partial [Clostridia bacterium]|nr:hypothetical protein [Clostridia bacterium]
MKKMVALIMAGISLLAMSLLGGCSMDKDYEEGYFIYRKSSADTVVALVGLTELGHEQKVIVMPETVAGYKYVIIDSKGLFGGVGPADWGENETVEKIYFQNQVEWTSHSLTPTFDT